MYGRPKHLTSISSILYVYLPLYSYYVYSPLYTYYVYPVYQLYYVHLISVSSILYVYSPLYTYLYHICITCIYPIRVSGLVHSHPHIHSNSRRHVCYTSICAYTFYTLHIHRHIPVPLTWPGWSGAAKRTPNPNPYMARMVRSP